MAWLNQLLNDVAGDKIQQVEKLLTPEKIQSLLADLKSIKIDGYGPFDSVLHQHGNVLRARNNAEHRNPLIAAVLYGAMKCLKFFVERVHIPIDSTGSIEAPGLMLAAALGHVDIFKYLVDNGSNIMMQGSDGSNVLHIAAKYGHKEILELAIAKGADLKAVDKFGMTVGYFLYFIFQAKYYTIGFAICLSGEKLCMRASLSGQHERSY
jgi:ankyrin repeat protein